MREATCALLESLRDLGGLVEPRTVQNRMHKARAVRGRRSIASERVLMRCSDLLPLRLSQIIEMILATVQFPTFILILLDKVDERVEIEWAGNLFIKFLHLIFLAVNADCHPVEVVMLGVDDHVLITDLHRHRLESEECCDGQNGQTAKQNGSIHIHGGGVIGLTLFSVLVFFQVFGTLLKHPVNSSFPVADRFVPLVVPFDRLTSRNADGGCNP